MSNSDRHTTYPVDILDSFDDDLIRTRYWNQKPFVLRGVGSEWPAAKWTIDYLKNKYSDTHVRVVKYDRSSDLSYLIQHKDMRYMPLRDFVDKFEGDDASIWSIKEDRGLFESHPELLGDLKFEEVTLLPEFKDASDYFWIGTANSTISLHADLGQWNMLYQILGRKKWIFFSPDDEQYLYVQTKSAIEGGLYSRVDAFNPDFDKYPEYALAKQYQVIVEPGDLIYVPNRWWHAVYSMTYTMSVNHISGELATGKYGELFRLFVTEYILPKTMSFVARNWIFVLPFVVLVLTGGATNRFQMKKGLSLKKTG